MEEEKKLTLESVAVPTYEVPLPSSGEKVRIRPFLVKDEKLLLLALEDDDPSAIIQTTIDTVNSCVIDWPPNKSIRKIPYFDVDYLFIALRAKSVSATVDVSFDCKNVVEDQECGESFPIQIDIANVEVENKENASRLIKLNDKFSVKMTCPPYHVMRAISDRQNETYQERVRLIAACIERIYQGEKNLGPGDFTPMEAVKWVEELTQEHFKKLEEFIDNFPTFVILGTGTCPKCGFVHNVRYDDFERFFTS